MNLIDISGAVEDSRSLRALGTPGRAFDLLVERWKSLIEAMQTDAASRLVEHARATWSEMSPERITDSRKEARLQLRIADRPSTPASKEERIGVALFPAVALAAREGVWGTVAGGLFEIRVPPLHASCSVPLGRASRIDDLTVQQLHQVALARDAVRETLRRLGVPPPGVHEPDLFIAPWPERGIDDDSFGMAAYLALLSFELRVPIRSGVVVSGRFERSSGRLSLVPSGHLGRKRALVQEEYGRDRLLEPSDLGDDSDLMVFFDRLHESVFETADWKTVLRPGRPQIERDIDLALRLYDEQQYEAAEKLLLRLSNDERLAKPSDGWTQFSFNACWRLGGCLDHRGRTTEARAHLERALSLAAEHHLDRSMAAECAASLGINLLDRFLFREAEAVVQQHLDGFEEHVALRERVGLGAPRRDPGDVRAMLLGTKSQILAYGPSLRSTEAVHCAREAVGLASAGQRSRSRCYLALALLREGRPAQALTEIDRALRENHIRDVYGPTANEFFIHLARARILGALGRWDEAQASIDRMEQLFVDDVRQSQSWLLDRADVLSWRAEVRYRVGRRGEARRLVARPCGDGSQCLIQLLETRWQIALLRWDIEEGAVVNPGGAVTEILDRLRSLEGVGETWPRWIDALATAKASGSTADVMAALETVWLEAPY